MPTYVPFITSLGQQFVTSDGYDFYVEGDASILSVDLYINTSEPARVDKSDYLSSQGSVSGTFREATDIINPVIMIEYGSVPTFNYIRISAFNRYYYVRNIVSVYKDLWAVECECDVLMSYKDYIYDLECLISRQQTASKCVNAQGVADTLLTIDNVLHITNTPFPNTPFNTSSDTLINNIVITVVGKGLGEHGDSTSSGTHIHNPSTNFPKASRYSNVYITNYQYLRYFLNKIWTSSIWESLKAAFNEPLEQIISIKMYPFDLTKENSSGKTRGVYHMQEGDKLDLGIVSLDLGIDITGFYQMNSNYDSIFEFGEVEIPWNLTRPFLNFEPYTELQLYLPYIGTIKLSALEFMNNKLSLEYSIDFSSGCCEAYIFRGEIGEGGLYTYTLAQSAEGIIGQDMPYSSVNGAAISREATSSILNAISGTSQTALGAAALMAII